MRWMLWGNLGADGAATWALPMETEGHARSSIIRRHVAGSAGPVEPKDGEMMESWVLASDTGFAQATHLNAHSYYGLPIDVGTPGFPCWRRVACWTFTFPSCP